MRRRGGFGLIEFILYFALLAIVMTGVTAFAVDFSRTRAKVAAVTEVEQNVRLVMMRFLRAVRQAERLNVGTSTLDSDNGVLSLDQPTAAATPTVFDLSNGVARIKEGSATATALTSDQVQVTKLRFSKDNLGGNNVAVTLELGVRSLTTNPAQEYNYAVSASSTAFIRKQ